MRKLLEQIFTHNVCHIPASIEKLPDNEMIMGDFIAVDERALFLSKESREDLWITEFISIS